MKRFLTLLSLSISIAILSVWSITTPETLPTEDTKWHIYKRKLFMKFLSFKRDRYSNNHIPLCQEKIDLVFLCIENEIDIYFLLLDIYFPNDGNGLLSIR